MTILVKEPMTPGTDQLPLILDGRAAAAALREKFSTEVAVLLKKHHILPGLAVVRVGSEPSSVTYAGRIIKAFGAVGLSATVIELPESATRPLLQAELQRVNSLREYAAVLVQFPLPGHLDLEAVTEILDPQKDVDGIHPVNIGRLALGLDCFVPATPAGGMALLDHYGISMEGKHAVVVGRSSIVGKPLVQLLLARNATVTIAHSRTRNLPGILRDADIVASATGKPGMISGDMLKPGCVVVDFGAAMVDGQMTGDVQFESAQRVAAAITPVPGGTGPMTNAMLIGNTLKAIRRTLPGRAR